ncbi:MAG TPA: cyclic 2,3-diphosphoglycerate synthase [archaeon]|nr:cyclic 2,3-diphosphoglycerate synthase [archaeon]
MKKINALILGAAGRDFHNFNTFFRNNSLYDVKAFTAAQIPDIAGRKYPRKLAGKFYRNGIPIYQEEKIEYLIKKFKIHQVFFSYSDLSHEQVMHLASRSMAAGATFVLLGPDDTMIKSTKPVIAVCAVRTGAGKSPTSQAIVDYFHKKYRIVVIRHPMPYGDLEKQEVQRFATYEDLEKNHCTIEEREEYEPHLRKGVIVYAGVDYEKILRAAEKEADIILWDGGNNDFSFYKPDLYITIVDPLRAGHEVKYHPGETNLRLADVLIISKVNSATREQIETVMKNIKANNPKARVIKGPIKLDVEGTVAGKRTLVVEDGPTLTHGGMTYGAGYVAAKRGKAKIVNAMPYAKGSIKGVYKKYPHLKAIPGQTPKASILPAMGYSKAQIRDLEATINAVKCDIVIDGSPVDLGKLVKSNKPIIRVNYRLAAPQLKNMLKKFEKEFL